MGWLILNPLTSCYWWNGGQPDWYVINLLYENGRSQHKREKWRHWDHNKKLDCLDLIEPRWCWSKSCFFLGKVEKVPVPNVRSHWPSWLHHQACGKNFLNLAIFCEHHRIYGRPPSKDSAKADFYLIGYSYAQLKQSEVQFFYFQNYKYYPQLVLSNLKGTKKPIIVCGFDREWFKFIL